MTVVSIDRAVEKHRKAVTDLQLRVAYWFVTVDAGELKIDTTEFNEFVDSLVDPGFLDTRLYQLHEDRNETVATASHQTNADVRRQYQIRVDHLNREIELVRAVQPSHRKVFEVLGETCAKDLFRALHMNPRTRGDAFRTACTALHSKSADGLFEWKCEMLQNTRDENRGTNPERHFKRIERDQAARKIRDVYLAEFEFDKAAGPGKELIIRNKAPADDEVTNAACAKLEKLFYEKLASKGKEHFDTCLARLREVLADIKYRRNGVVYLVPGHLEPLVAFVEGFVRVVSHKFSPEGEEGFEFLGNPLLDCEQTKVQVEKADAKVRGHIAKTLDEAITKLEELRERKEAWEEWAADVAKADGSTEIPEPEYEDGKPVPQVTASEYREVANEVLKLRNRAKQYAVFSQEELLRIETSLDTLDKKRAQLEGSDD
jgi:hypothetical protein